MINNIKISIIISIYNSEKYLKKCLNSIKNQSFIDYEVICLNASSTDNSLEILKEFQENDSRFLIINRPYEYAGASRNAGLKIAKGNYIIFMDSDDLLYKESLQYAYEVMNNNNYDFAVMGSQKFKDGTSNETPVYNLSYITKILKTDIYNPLEHDLDIFYLPNFVWGKIYNRKFLINNNIFYDDLKFAEDTLFCVKCYTLAKQIVFRDINFYKYRESNCNSTSAFNKHYADLVKAYQDSCEYLLNAGNKYLFKSFIKCTVNTLIGFFFYHELNYEDKCKFYSLIRNLFIQISLNTGYNFGNQQQIFSYIIQHKDYSPEMETKKYIPIKRVEFLGIPIFEIRKKRTKLQWYLFKRLPIFKISLIGK